MLKTIIRDDYEYDAWGAVTAYDIDGSGIAELNPIRYRSYYWDNNIQMYYLQSRWYDPTIMRFINMDIVGILDTTMHVVNGLNLYGYCVGGNPVMHYDPTGRFIVLILIGGAIIIGGGVIADEILNDGQIRNDVIGWVDDTIIQPVVENWDTILMTAGSLLAIGLGTLLLPTGLGAIFIGAGMGSLIGGFSSKASGGSFFAGWVGGGITGAAMAGTAWLGMGMLNAGKALVGAGGLLIAGFGGMGASILGDVATSVINGNPVDWNRTIVRSGAMGLFNMAMVLPMGVVIRELMENGYRVGGRVFAGALEFLIALMGLL